MNLCRAGIEAKNRRVSVRRGAACGANLEIRIDIYTLPYVTQIASSDHRIAQSSAHCSVIT